RLGRPSDLVHGGAELRSDAEIGASRIHGEVCITTELVDDAEAWVWRALVVLAVVHLGRAWISVRVGIVAITGGSEAIRIGVCLLRVGGVWAVVARVADTVMICVCLRESVRYDCWIEHARAIVEILWDPIYVGIVVYERTSPRVVPDGR